MKNTLTKIAIFFSLACKAGFEHKEFLKKFEEKIDTRTSDSFKHMLEKTLSDIQKPGQLSQILYEREQRICEALPWMYYEFTIDPAQRLNVFTGHASAYNLDFYSIPTSIEKIKEVAQYFFNPRAAKNENLVKLFAEQSDAFLSVAFILLIDNHLFVPQSIELLLTYCLFKIEEAPAFERTKMIEELKEIFKITDKKRSREE